MYSPNGTSVYCSGGAEFEGSV